MDIVIPSVSPLFFFHPICYIHESSSQILILISLLNGFHNSSLLLIVPMLINVITKNWNSFSHCLFPEKLNSCPKNENFQEVHPDSRLSQNCKSQRPDQWGKTAYRSHQWMCCQFPARTSCEKLPCVRWLTCLVFEPGHYRWVPYLTVLWCRLSSCSVAAVQFHCDFPCMERERSPIQVVTSGYLVAGRVIWTPSVLLKNVVFRFSDA